MDNHLRIERKENLRIEHKEEDARIDGSVQKEAQTATKSTKATKTVPKTIKAHKMLANTANKKIHLAPPKKCWSLLANAKERPNKGKCKQ